MVPWIAHGKILTTEAERVQRRTVSLQYHIVTSQKLQDLQNKWFV